MKKLLYISFILFYFLNNASGQDIHWSQFDYNPVFQNPANLGQFNDGDFRFHANYRDQWRSVTVPFQTFSVSADAKSVFHDNLSLGAFFFSDITGDGAFTTIEILPSASWLFKLTPDSVHTMRLAGQFGLNYRQFNADAFTFDSQWNGVAFDPSLSTNEMFMSQSRSNGTFGIGTSYEYFITDRKRITTGIGLFNINRPNHGFFGEDIPRNRRFNFFVNAQHRLNDKWDILPSLQFNFQGTYREMVIGSRMRYILVNEARDYKAIVMGVYSRLGDAAYIMTGIEWQNWWGGISYDINYSSLTPASRARGGVEFSVRYILKTIKKSNTIYRVCPDYI